MNAYSQLKDRQEKEFNEFPMFYAFNDKQFGEGMEKFGLSSADTDKIYSAGAEGYYLRTDSQKLKDLLNRHEKEMSDAIKADTTGDGFIFDMFDYELSNHEYCYTGDTEDTLDALGLSMEEIEKSPALSAGLKNAIISQLSEN